MGQTDGQVDFLARGLGYTVFLTRQGAVLSLAENQKSEIRNQKQETTDQRPRATDILRLNLVGAKRGAGARGLEELAGQSNYFIGNDPRKWRRNVRTFGKVEYSEVYPGVDLVYYGNQGKLEYDFVVARGADPSAITLDVGAGLVPAPVPSRPGPVRGRPRGSPLRIDGGGDLWVQTDGGEVRLHKPVVYQPVAAMSPSPIGGQRPPLRHSVVKGQWQNATDNASHPKSKIENPKFLEGHYVLTADNHIHFAIPSYDKTRALVIDPVLDYSTYLGGTGGDVALGIAVDSAGNAIIGGMTNSSDFPVKNGASGGYRGSGDAFISKFDFVSGTGTGTGLTMVYSTYLGGSGTDSAASIAVDASDDVFITGPTTSTDFPITPTVSGPSTTSGFQTTWRKRRRLRAEHCPGQLGQRLRDRLDGVQQFSGRQPTPNRLEWRVGRFSGQIELPGDDSGLFDVPGRFGR